MTLTKSELNLFELNGRNQIMTRRYFIAGNWKMHNNTTETKELLTAMKQNFQNINDSEVMVAPSFTSLQTAKEILEGTQIIIASQDCHSEDKGAFTSAVSCPQLKEFVSHVILGHSERRSVFGDTDIVINKKLKATLAHQLVPVLCIGETLQERESNKTLEILKAQLDGGLAGFEEKDLETLIIAYEPVWAIGTGKTASPQQAQETHEQVRKHLADMYSQEFADKTRILYGGSVKPENVDELMGQTDIDGALVGGKSLEAESFLRIINFKK
jgi:triosephosphate isomerase (TIM)